MPNLCVFLLNLNKIAVLHCTQWHAYVFLQHSMHVRVYGSVLTSRKTRLLQMIVLSILFHCIANNNQSELWYMDEVLYLKCDLLFEITILGIIYGALVTNKKHTQKREIASQSVQCIQWLNVA